LCSACMGMIPVRILSVVSSKGHPFLTTGSKLARMGHAGHTASPLRTRMRSECLCSAHATLVQGMFSMFPGKAGEFPSPRSLRTYKYPFDSLFLSSSIHRKCITPFPPVLQRIPHIMRTRLQLVQRRLFQKQLPKSSNHVLQRISSSRAPLSALAGHIANLRIQD
jgi:hypothetical protein